MAYENLFRPISIRGLTLRNRVVFPAMATKMIRTGGYMTQKLTDYHVARVRGGAGLNITEATSVHTPSAPCNFLGINDDKFLPGLKKFNEAIHEASGRSCVQLWQGGLAAVMMDPKVVPVLPSELSFFSTIYPAASVELIHDCVNAFGEAAKRAVEAGFDCVEFHCAHNYSPHSFLSGGLNRRTDEYGGTFENRMRYPLECIRAIRTNIPTEMPLLIRVSAHDDFLPNGITIEDMVEFLNQAKKVGVDAVDVSRGNIVTPAQIYEVPPIDIPLGFNVHNAERIRSGTGLVTIAVGRINDPSQAEGIIAEGKADMVVIGRGQIADPEFCNKALAGRPDDIVKCMACNQGCYDRYVSPEYEHISCLLNPAVGREAEFSLKKAEKPKTVLIAGGGMAGMEAAMILKERGHHPIFCEETDELGGQFLMAGIAPRLGEIREVTLAKGRQTVRMGVDVQLSTKVTPMLLEKIKPDAVIIATGAEPMQLNVPGADASHVMDSWSVLKGKQSPWGNVVVIGGGLVGLEVAEYLAEKNEDVKSVTVVEMLDDVGMDLGPLRKQSVMEHIKEYGIKTLVKTKCFEFQKDAVIAEGKAEQQRIPCDSIVVAVGSKSKDYVELQTFCEKKGIPCTVIGDARKPRKAIDAVEEAADVARRI